MSIAVRNARAVSIAGSWTIIPCKVTNVLRRCPARKIIDQNTMPRGKQ